MKVLNLYAGIGGNRKLWKDVNVTAVEINEEIARAYKDNFPDDNVVVTDAHQYLLENFDKFDFIWSSPPCQTHSRARYWGWSGKNPVYPDATLYQEVTLLRHHSECKWLVENVEPYYDPWIQPDKRIDRHLFWSNFQIGNFVASYKVDIHKSGKKPYEDAYGFNLDEYNIERKDRKLRNCVHPEIGKYILDRAKDIHIKSQTEQMELL